MNKTNILEFLKILYVDYGKSRKPALFHSHSHNFWQVEFILNGHPDLELSGSKISLQPADIVVIPPGFTHRFNYFQQPKEDWSFKFSCEAGGGIKPFAIRDEEKALILRDALIKLATLEDDITRSAPAAMTLAALLADHCFSAPEDIQLSALELKVKDLIFRFGRWRGTVENIARHLGYSPNYLSFLFKKQCKTSLKRFIDRQICDIAAHHLKYSEYNIEEIAAMMQFPDRYAFSHFFKRVSGRSPARFRRDEY